MKLAAVMEIRGSVEGGLSSKPNPAEMGFYPFNLGGKTEKQQYFMQEAELFNGRLGMLAITGFAIEEWFLSSAVVDQTSVSFKPLNVAMEQLMNS